MSLRKEVHSAIDGIAPSTFGMPERVVQTVLHDAKRRRKGKFMLRLRAPLSLVAVLVLIALVAAVLVGGRIIHDWNQFHNSSPAGHSDVDQFASLLADLESRPVTLPMLKSTDVCPTNSGTNSAGFQFGNGPVYTSGGPATTTSWGDFFDVTYHTDPNLTGPVLIRGRDLQSNRQLVFVGKNANGPIVDTDPGQNPSVLRSELVLDAAHPPKRTAKGYGSFPARQGMASGWSHCFGIQIDGPKYTEVITGAG